jgi:hypothetical protein
MVSTKNKNIIIKKNHIVSDSTLYDNFHPEKSLKGTGFKNAQVALNTLKLISKRSLKYQFDVVNTMYNRAKYIPHKTKDIEEAMKIFHKWLKIYPNLKKKEDSKYPWLPLKTIEKYESIANTYEVSQVARGIKKGTRTDKGFLEMYKDVLGKKNKLQYIPVKQNKPNGQDYWSYRIGFINSRLGQIAKAKTPLYYKSGVYKDLPTKQHIILIIHGYSPDKKLYKL